MLQLEFVHSIGDTALTSRGVGGCSVPEAMELDLEERMKGRMHVRCRHNAPELAGTMIVG